MIPPHKTPSAELLARIRRYIAAHLRDASDMIEEASSKMPHPAPRPFDEERERHDIRRRDAMEEPVVFGAGAIAPGIGTHLDNILSRLKSKLDKSKETFSDRLLRLISERGMTDAEAYKRAGIDRKYFSKIRNGQAPSAKVIYAFIFALRLNIDEARDLLASAGYSISPARAYDLVMEFCILEGCDIDTVNGILYEMGMDVL